MTPHLVQPERQSTRFCLVKDDETFYLARMPFKVVEKLMADWNEFKKLDIESKNAVIDVVLQDTSNRRQLEYINQSIDEWLNKQNARESSVAYNTLSQQIIDEIDKFHTESQDKDNNA